MAGFESSSGSPDRSAVDAAAALLSETTDRRSGLTELRTREVVFLVGPDEAIRWVSESVADVLGWRPSQLIGASIAELIHPEDRAAAVRLAADVRRRRRVPGATESWVLRLRGSDGAHRWMSANLAVVTDQAGRVTGVASAWIDVDDVVRLRREADLTQSKLHAVVDSLFDPHVGLRAVRGGDGSVVDFEFVDLNEAACLRLGGDRAALVGRRLLEVDPHRKATGLFAACVATVDTGQPLFLRSSWADPGAAGDQHVFEARGARVGDGLEITWRDVATAPDVSVLPTPSEARYQVLAEAPTDVVVVGGTDGVIQWISEGVTCLLGSPPEHVRGRLVVELVHPDDASAAVAAHAALLAGQARTVILRLATADGGWRWVRIAARPVLDDEGRVIGRVASWRDAEEEMRDRRERTASDERYRFLVENASDVVFRAGPDSLLEWISPSVEQLIGRAPEELIGHAPAEFIAPADLEALQSATQEVHAGTALTYRGRIVHADGTARYVSATVRPTFGEGGELTGSVGAIRDVTDEMRALDALAAAERRFHLLADHATDLVAHVDDDGRLLWASPNVRGWLGLEPTELVGVPLARVVHADDHEAVAALLREAATRGSTAEGPTRLLRVERGDAGHRWMSATATRLDEEAGEVGVVVGMRDVDDLVEARQVAESERARAVATFDTFLDPHVVFEAVRDADGEVVDFVFVEANDAACTYNGLARDELLGSRLLDLLPASTETGLMAEYRRVLATGEPLILDDFEYPHELLEEARTYDIRASKLGDGFGFTWRDVTERHRRTTELAARATLDGLTGLGNRHAILDELGRALASAARSGRTLAVLMVDLDHFKNVNDSLGHPVGDELLKAAAARLVHTSRAGDLVGRLGGDEFVVVMRDLDDEDEAVGAAARIVAEFRAPLRNDDLAFYATASIGVAVARPDSTPDDLLREADTALYRAKAEGRDRASMFNEDLRERALERLTIEAQLRPALANGELELWYQPEVELETGSVIAVEALLRWLHPSGELYTADRFIEIAEETGLIHEIGGWVFTQACRQAAAWAAARPDSRITVRVNLSALQLAEPKLFASLDAALAETGVDPTLLCVEITETAFLHETTTVRANLQALRDRGVHVALDDFGTGYASLAYLREFPIHVIKIDRSFTATMLDDDYERRLIAGIIALAELLDMRVTAEGIESPEQAELLVELGCTSGQGFLYSRAVPAAEVELLFDRRFR